MSGAGSSSKATSALARLAPRRVAVFRALQLGDLLCTVPAFRALRADLPGAEIVLIGLPWARSFVDRFSAYLDGFREFPGYPGLPEQPARIEALSAFLAGIQAERFDLVLQWHGSGILTNSLASTFGGARTGGFFVPGHFRPDPELFTPLDEDAHEIRRPLQHLEALGVPLRGEYLEFPLDPRDLEQRHALLHALRVDSAPYICIHAGSRNPTRRWAVENYAAAADELVGLGFRIILTGSRDEARLTRSLAEAMHAPALDLAGRTDLGVLAALLRGARLLLCNNTGVCHLAAALNVPSVNLFHHPAEVARWAPLERERHRVVCDLSAAALEPVLAEARELLSLPAPTPLLAD